MSEDVVYIFGLGWCAFLSPAPQAADCPHFAIAIANAEVNFIYALCCHAICSYTEPVTQNLFGTGPYVPLHCFGHCSLTELMFDCDGFSVLVCASFFL